MAETGYQIRDQHAIYFITFSVVEWVDVFSHNGKLLFRLRPSENDFIESNIDKPYEIHLVEFEIQQDFENFMKDEERKKFLHLKEQSIRTSILIKGTKL